MRSLPPPAPSLLAGMWRLLGRLSDTQKGLVEERLKSVDKDLAKRGLAPGCAHAVSLLQSAFAPSARRAEGWAV